MKRVLKLSAVLASASKPVNLRLLPMASGLDARLSHILDSSQSHRFFSLDIKRFPRAKIAHELKEFITNKIIADPNVVSVGVRYEGSAMGHGKSIFVEIGLLDASSLPKGIEWIPVSGKESTFMMRSEEISSSVNVVFKQTDFPVALTPFEMG